MGGEGGRKEGRLLSRLVKSLYLSDAYKHILTFVGR